MSFPMAIAIDAGAREWRFGWCDDEGNCEVAAGTAAGDVQALRERLGTAFEILEAEPSEHALLVSERPGATDAEREAIAAAIFADHGVQSLWFVAAPLLALYNAGKDTGVVVDVGETCTYILPVYEGHPVLAAATVVPLGGGLLPHSGADASCDGLFTPPQGGNSGSDGGDGAAAAVCGLAEAVLRTVALADTSLRAPLLASVILVGGGSRLADFPERMQRELTDAIDASGTPWVARCVANADRRIAAWIGGTLLCGMPSAQSLFLTSEAHAAEPAQLHALAASLPCTTLADQEARQQRARRQEAEEREAEGRASKARSAQQAEQARVWWMDEAPAGGHIERQRQHCTQRCVMCVPEHPAIEFLTPTPCP